MKERGIPNVSAADDSELTTEVQAAPDKSNGGATPGADYSH